MRIARRFGTPDIAFFRSTVVNLNAYAVACSRYENHVTNTYIKTLGGTII